MVVEPREKQCATVQKLGLNASKLEQATMESMSHWFIDKEHPENAEKKLILKEIFEVAKAEERYKDGAIGKTAPLSATQFKDSCVLVDGMTCFSVLCGETKSVDDPDNDECDERVKDELIFPSASPTPDTLIRNKLLQQADWGDFYSVHTIPTCHYSQPQFRDHTLYGDGSHVTCGYQDPDRCAAIPSTYEGLQQPMHGL